MFIDFVNCGHPEKGRIEKTSAKKYKFLSAIVLQFPYKIFKYLCLDRRNYLIRNNADKVGKVIALQPYEVTLAFL